MNRRAFVRSLLASVAVAPLAACIVPDTRGKVPPAAEPLAAAPFVPGDYVVYVPESGTPETFFVTGCYKPAGRRLDGVETGWIVAGEMRRPVPGGGGSYVDSRIMADASTFRMVVPAVERLQRRLALMAQP